MQIEDPELESLLKSMPEDERRIAELFAHVLGESHVLNCIKKDKEQLFSPSRLQKKEDTTK